MFKGFVLVCEDNFRSNKPFKTSKDNVASSQGKQRNVRDLNSESWAWALHILVTMNLQNFEEVWQNEK